MSNVQNSNKKKRQNIVHGKCLRVCSSQFDLETTAAEENIATQYVRVLRIPS
jgi:hypothetical protein